MHNKKKIGHTGINLRSQNKTGTFAILTKLISHNIYILENVNV